MLGRLLVYVRPFLQGSPLFLLFALGYVLPFGLDSSIVSLDDPSLEHLIDSAFALQVVRFELLRNLLAVAVPLLLVFLLCYWVGLVLARQWGLRPFVVRILVLFIAWVGLASGNAWLFPSSNYSVSLWVLADPVWALMSTTLLALGLFRALFVLSRGALLGGVGVALCGLVGFGGLFGLPAASAVNSQRDIILIGVDSLSAYTFEQNKVVLPNLAGLMEYAKRYSRAYTPLGRTFPAWVSILSGHLPAEHGAVFNLRSMEHVQRRGLMPSVLKDMSYHTVFAIDERRFSNIDKSFGFDRVVGPQTGVLDFALQGVNDNPLSNLLLQTRLGAYLFPFSYVNVAAYANYSAEGFVERVLDASQINKSLFLAVHFESGHFPYKTRHGQPVGANSRGFDTQYLQALTVVDKQVGWLLQGLKRQGRLDDALVVLLSDHGEALGEVEATVLRDGLPFEVRSYGHGGDLLSDRQNRILLGTIEFRKGEPAGVSEDHVRQVSLLDVRALVESYARGGGGVLDGGGCLIVETGIRLLSTRDFRSLNGADVAAQAAPLYEVDRRGLLRLREDRLPELLAGKDIGWRCSNRLTWYDSGGQRFLAYELDGHGVPVEQVEPETSAIAHISAYRDLYLQ